MVCPKCGNVAADISKDIEFWRQKIGPEYMVCPYCRRKIPNLKRTEWAHIKDKRKFTGKYMAFELAKAILLGCIFGMAISSLFGDGSQTVCMVITSVLLFAFYCVSFKMEIKESLERTGNPENAENTDGTGDEENDR